MSTVTGYPPPDPYQQEPGQFYMHQMAPPQPPKKGLPAAAIVGIVVGGLVLLLCVGGAITAALQGNSKPTSNTAPTTAATTTPPVTAVPTAPPPTTAPPAQPAGPLTSFGDGTYEIGTTAGLIAAGKYKATVPKDSFGCYYARLKGLSGSLNDIIANNVAGPGEPVIVTISATDAAFNTTGCGTWSKA